MMNRTHFYQAKLTIIITLSTQMIHLLQKKNIKHSNKSNASVVMQRPGESFAIAERRVRERLKKKKDEGLIKKGRMHCERPG